MNTFSNDTVKWLTEEIEFNTRQAAAARETQQRQQEAADKAREAAEWHDQRVADTSALLEYIGFINVPDVAGHDPADCGTCDDHADTQRDADRAEQQLDGAR